MLFNDIDQIKTFVNVPAELDWDRIEPMVEPAATRNLKPVLGAELLGLLDTHVEESGTDPEMIALLPHARRALAPFIFSDNISQLDVVVTSTGIGVVHNQNVAPASKDRVKALKENLEEQGYLAIEELYEFLEENEDDYPEWTDSDAYSKHFELFLQSAAQFEDYVIIGKSRRKFLDMIPAMKRVEQFEIIPKISEDLATTIKDEIKADTVSTANALALDLIRGALANLTMHELIQLKVEDQPAYTQGSAVNRKKDEQYRFERAGAQYISELRKLLDGSPDDYPDYRDSGIYDEDLENYESYENEEDDEIFVFGG